MQQTIKVNVATDKISTVFAIGQKAIAETWEQNGTQYCEMLRVLHPYGCRQDIRLSLADAVEFISDAIERHFKAYGLNVEFVAA